MYEFTEKMGEISGFGGSYEGCCRKMLKAGLEWFDAHPDAQPKFRGFEGIYGVITEDNLDANALSKAVCDAAEPEGATGAMHQAVIKSIFWIRKHGWKKYIEMMSRARREDTED